MESLNACNIEIYHRKKGLIIQDSVLVVYNENGRIINIGNSEPEAIHQPNARAVIPIKNGRITDSDAAGRVLGWYLAHTGKRFFRKPDIVVCIPSVLTDAESETWINTLLLCGARTVHLVELTRDEYLQTAGKNEFDLIISFS